MALILSDITITMADAVLADMQQCNNCSRSFKSKWKLKRHMFKVHDILDPSDHVDHELVCKDCNETFDHTVLLEVHLRDVHKIDGSNARKTVRSQRERNSSSVDTDPLTDEDFDSKSCHICNQNFRKRKFYRKHMAQTHDIIPPEDVISPAIQCDICEVVHHSKIKFEIHLTDCHSMTGKGARIYINNRLKNRPSLRTDELTPDRPSTSKLVPRAPVGQKTKCPICSDKFSRRFTAIAHMRKKHPMPEEELESFIQQIPTVLTECDKCGVWKSNISSHRKICKGQLDKANPQSTEIPPEFLPGGENIMPMFEKYLTEGELTEKTVRQYLHKMVKVGRKWENDIRNFKLDKLIFPLETETTLPSLLQYTKEVEDTDALVAIKAYKHFVAFLKEVFVKYESDDRFPIEKRASWKRYCTEQVEELGKKQKQLVVRIDQKTKAKAADAIESGTDLAFNHDKLKMVLKHLLENPEFLSPIEALREMPDEDLKQRFTEVEVRQALAVYILITSGGQRPHVITRMRVGEFLSASQSDGNFVVRVQHHKTSLKYGPMHLVFNADDYRAVHRYLQTYCPPDLENDRFVFATRTGNEFQMKHAVNWARSFLSGVLTPAEMKTLTAMATRKGSSNWAQDHSDANVNKKAFAVMGHSKDIQARSYNVTRDQDAVQVKKAVVEDTLMKADKLKRVTNHGRRGRFNMNEKNLITKALCQRRSDGSMMPPTGVTNKLVDQALGKYPAFAKLYKGLVKDKQGKRSKANNILWTAIRRTQKNQPDSVQDQGPSTSRTNTSGGRNGARSSESTSSIESEVENDSDSSVSGTESRYPPRRVITPGGGTTNQESQRNSTESDTD